jgi:hypothetical protein
MHFSGAEKGNRNGFAKEFAAKAPLGEQVFATSLALNF